jgi:hypothetical protein
VSKESERRLKPPLHVEKLKESSVSVLKLSKKLKMYKLKKMLRRRLLVKHNVSLK